MERELPDISDMLKKICSLCLYAFDGTYGYFILSFKKKSTWDKILDTALKEVAEKNKYIITLSLPTEELTKISGCFSQVLAMNHILSLTKDYNAPRCQDTILKKISYRSFRVLMVKLPAHTSCNKRHPGIHHQWMSGVYRCCTPAYTA